MTGVLEEAYTGQNDKETHDSSEKKILKPQNSTKKKKKKKKKKKYWSRRISEKSGKIPTGKIVDPKSNF